jgi:hypothetical protein
MTRQVIAKCIQLGIVFRKNTNFTEYSNRYILIREKQGTFAKIDQNTVLTVEQVRVVGFNYIKDVLEYLEDIEKGAEYVWECQD